MKQLEIFAEHDFEHSKTYFRKTNGGTWVLISHIDRSDFNATRRIPYKMVVNLYDNGVYDEKHAESRPMSSDADGEKITASDYIRLSMVLKQNGKYTYNKKLGKAIPKI